jgi:hypothetical protein
MSAATWLWLVAVLAGNAAAPPSFAPGTSLAALLSQPVDPQSRFGLNGAPPGAFASVPEAPEQSGSHWLVAYDADGNVVAWYRFEVQGGSASVPAAPRELPLLLDSTPPQAELRVDGPQVQADRQLVLGADARVQVEASDPSGGVVAELRVNGVAIDAASMGSQSLPDGAATLSVEVVDALGNRAERVQTAVWLDRSPPTLEWQRLDPPAGAPGDVFDGRRVRLRLHAEDAAAGLATLRVGGRELDPLLASSEGVTVELAGDQLHYRLEDRVGNRIDGRLALRVDRSGPELQAWVDDTPAALDGLRVQRQQGLRLIAVDTPAGVASACIEASVWYGECRALPMLLVGLSTGRYTLRFKAVDSLGNRSARRLKLEVLR